MIRTFTKNDGLIPVDLVHCGLDHLTASKLLFGTGPHLFDSAGYLAHLGIEMLLKGWLLEVNGAYEGTHSLKRLHSDLVGSNIADPLESILEAMLGKLDGYEQLRYPNLVSPTEVGDDDWFQINQLAGEICRSMPKTIEAELKKINASDSHSPVTKAGRTLMKKKKEVE